jgi:membrane protein YqaA with SNARE-associated domain
MDRRDRTDEALASSADRAALTGRQRTLRIAALLFVIALSVGIALYGHRLVGLGAYGYPGLFLLNLLASATLILPAPGLALAFAAGASLSPWLVGLAVGSGSTLGELTGYVAGYSGRGTIENDPQYARVHGWMTRFGLWVIFLLSLVPNPLFDVAGITAGVMKIPVWQFLSAAWFGKVIKSTLVALAGAGMMSTLGPIIREWLTR